MKNDYSAGLLFDQINNLNNNTSSIVIIINNSVRLDGYKYQSGCKLAKNPFCPLNSHPWQIKKHPFPLNFPFYRQLCPKYLKYSLIFNFICFSYTKCQLCHTLKATFCLTALRRSSECGLLSVLSAQTLKMMPSLLFEVFTV